jgi:alkanesulfonate monooxygenase SsuD/methylene tetrahydromethanopterin reductase-like flavin-dependent oxidoreductase (luciferase family)
MTDEIDDRIQKSSRPILNGPNRLKLAVFSPNMAGGTNLTSAGGPPIVTWAEQMRIAAAAEQAGFEAIIPVARWRSPSPSASPTTHRSFESFTWAAGISVATSVIQVFATCHITTTHPIMVAKQIATLDHISGGRFGLNVVAGWNADEFRMFDLTLTEHSDRYAIADEWMSFVERIFTDEQPFDVVGNWFKSFDVISQPLPLQQPGPVVMSAGFSPAGRGFAAKHADVNFVIAPDRSEARQAITAVKARARNEFNRDLRVFGAAHILCAPSEDAARRRYEEVVTERGDWAAARDHASQPAGAAPYHARGFLDGRGGRHHGDAGRQSRNAGAGGG